MTLDRSVATKFPWWELLLVLVLVVVLAWYTLGRFGGAGPVTSTPSGYNQPTVNSGDQALAARLNQPVHNSADPTAERALLERLNRPQ